MKLFNDWPQSEERRDFCQRCARKASNLESPQSRSAHRRALTPSKETVSPDRLD